MKVIINDREKALHLYINIKAVYVLAMMFIAAVVNIIFDGDDGSGALILLVILVVNSLWFVLIQYKDVMKKRLLAGALILLSGLFYLSFSHSYKAALTLLLHEFIYIVFLALYGGFLRNKNETS